MGGGHFVQNLQKKKIRKKESGCKKKNKQKKNLCGSTFQFIDLIMQTAPESEIGLENQ